MRLAEALMERKDLVKKINKVKEEIKSNLVTREDFALPFDMDALFEDYTVLQNELQEISVRIEKTNAEHLADKLSELRNLDAQICFLKECRIDLLSSHDTYYERDAKMVRNMNINSVNQILEQLEKDRRELDKAIQRINWDTNI